MHQFKICLEGKKHINWEEKNKLHFFLVIFRPFVWQIQTTDAFEKVMHDQKSIGNQTTFSCFIITNRKLLVAY